MSNRLINPDRIKNETLRNDVLTFMAGRKVEGVYQGVDVDHQYPWRSKGPMISVYSEGTSKAFYLKDYEGRQPL